MCMVTPWKTGGKAAERARHSSRDIRSEKRLLSVWHPGLETSLHMGRRVRVQASARRVCVTKSRRCRLDRGLTTSSLAWDENVPVPVK